MKTTNGDRALIAQCAHGAASRAQRIDWALDRTKYADLWRSEDV